MNRIAIAAPTLNGWWSRRIQVAIQLALMGSFLGMACGVAVASETESQKTSGREIREFLTQSCADCHGDGAAEGGFEYSSLVWNLETATTRDPWIRIYDRVAKREMPPDPDSISDADRAAFLVELKTRLKRADQTEICEQGRGPMRRLNRDEYQENLREILALPHLDIRDILPEDREAFHFNKSAAVLDLSRVQLTAYLSATERALEESLAESVQPPPVTKFQAIGTNLFAALNTFGNREAMFFAKDSQILDYRQREEWQSDPEVEMALFRSAHWPYFGYPRGFVAERDGEYRVTFSARAVVQLPGFTLQPAAGPVPMTFRARKPSGPDVSGDVRATGGWIDVPPELTAFETTVLLKAGETIEYSLLGLPVPLARNVDGGAPTYRYPPISSEGQRGVAFRSLKIEGPIQPQKWPPNSHRILFADLPIQDAAKGSTLPIEVISDNPREDATRLFRRFVDRAARGPVSEASIRQFEQLIDSQLESGATFTEAMLIGYQAFLCSSHLVYLHEPHGAQDQFAIANRLSHFLTNSRPDQQLMELARQGRLRDTAVLRQETERLLQSPGFDRFVQNFTDYWLNLRHTSRDEPDVQRYPEYRFDNYLVESMARETRAFFAAMVRENLPARVVIDADFVFVNDRLAEHYSLNPVDGSQLRKVDVPHESSYGGLMTQAAILKVTANGTSTSPIVRGAWIMDRLVGQPPPPPPPNVPAVEPDIRGAKTIRELLALHTQSSSCASCHAKFDSVGLALENFDILGGWRTRYRGLEEGDRVSGIDRAGHDYSYTLASPVDASGELVDGRRFEDVRDLKSIFAADDRTLARNLLHQFTVYATGSPVRFSERDVIEQILDDCQQNDYRVGDLLHAFIASPIFLGEPSRTGEAQ